MFLTLTFPWPRSELTIQASNEFGLDLKVPCSQLLVKKRFEMFYPVKARSRDKAWVMVSEQGVLTLGWAKMHEVFKSLLPRYFLKDIYVK